MLALNELLLPLVRGVFLTLALISFIDLLRFRGPIQWDVFLMFGSLATMACIGLVDIPGPIPLLVVAAQPFLLLRLTRYFRSVPRFVHVLSLGGMGLTWLTILFTLGWPLPAALGLPLFYVVFTGIYAAHAFFQGARLKVGVTYWRLRLAALASVMIIVAVISLALAMLPSAVSFPWLSIGLSLLLIAGIAFYLGFVPPRWLTQSWQRAELQRYLEGPVGSRSTKAERQLLTDLRIAALRAVGGHSSMVLLGHSELPPNQMCVNGDDARILTVAPALEVVRHTGKPSILATRQVFPIGHEKTSLAVEAPVALVSPIGSDNHSAGLLLVFLTHQPFFVRDDLNLLGLLSNQVALSFEKRRLFQTIARNNGLLEERVAQRTAQLQAHNEDLDAFAHNVAHDLRSPIQNLYGTLYLLQTDDRLNHEQRHYLSMAKESADHLQQIIDDLLLLAETRDGEVPIQDVSMAEVVEEALRRLHRQIVENDATIHLPQCWPAARGYGPWLVEVWVNYLSNAIKYGGRPPQLHLGASQHQDGSVRFFVQDNGAGINEDELKRVFEPFERLDRRDAAGHGLGLSIVSRIIGKLDGTFGASSKTDRGSTFWFQLPGLPTASSCPVETSSTPYANLLLRQMDQPRPVSAGQLQVGD